MVFKVFWIGVLQEILKYIEFPLNTKDNKWYDIYKSV